MPQTLDQDAVNLAKAIRQKESGGNFNAPGASGEHGGYQFMPETWKNYSAQAGVNVPLEQATPDQQNEVAYKKIKEWKDKGYNPGQIASMWNAGEGKPNAYLEGNKGTNSKGVAYDTGAYAKDVATIYQQLKTQGGGQNLASAAPAPTPQNGSVTPSEYKPNDFGVTAASASTGDAAPESLGDKALGLAGSVGDFFFPIVKDLYHDVKGTSDKTALQQIGDAGLSAVSLIPGLGEAGAAGKLGLLAGKLGLAAKGAKAAEGTAAAVKSTGLLSKLTGSTVAKGAGVGYGAGVSQNLSQGKSVGESLSPNLNTIGGTVLGGAVPLATKAVSGLVNKASGIAENVKPILANLSDKGLYDKYINAANARAENVTNPSPLEVAADYTEKAVKGMKDKLQVVGKSINELKTTEGEKPLADLTPVLKNFAKNVEDKFGLNINISPTGKKITLKSAPGRMKDILSPADQGRIKRALTDLITLRKTGNVRKASDVIDNLDNLVDYAKKDLLGNSNDPLESFLKTTRHDLNGVVGASSPALAEAKTRAHELNTALETVRGAGGGDLQRAELLLKRVFSGDQSAKSREVFDIIKKETGIDLTEHAVLAKHAINAVGDPSQTSLLSQLLQNSTKEGAPSLTGLLLSGGKHALQSTVANPEKVGRNIVEGKKGLVPSLLSKGRPTKAALQTGRVVSGLLGQ